MMIRPGNGGRKGAIRKRISRGDAASPALGLSPVWPRLERVALSPARENRRQLVRRDDFELIEGALLRLLVEPPAAKLRCVAKTRPLHMVKRPRPPAPDEAVPKRDPCLGSSGSNRPDGVDR